MVATGVGKRGASNGENGASLEFEFHSPEMEIPQDVVQYTQDKLQARLGKHGRRVMGVVVHVRDVNGPRGGVGVACHVEVRLSGMEPVNVEEQDADLRAAIDLAIDRMDVVVGRHVTKVRSVTRTKGAKLARNSKTTS